MSEQNPYQPPAANIEMSAPVGQLSGAKGVAVGRGLSWYGEGFDLFKQNPWIWILNIVLFFIIMSVMSVVPFVSILTSLLYPVFVGGLILGCRDLDEGNELNVSHVFAGFQHRTGTLIGLGAINMVLSILFVAIIFGVMIAMGSLNFEAMETGQMSDEQALSMSLAVLIGMLFMFHNINPYSSFLLVTVHGSVKLIDKYLLFGSGIGNAGAYEKEKNKKTSWECKMGEFHVLITTFPIC